jgi:hypothetical protein
MRYYVHSTKEKVYIEGLKGCEARLCAISGEFFYPLEVIYNCSFKKFQEMALSKGYIISDKHRPLWDVERSKG